MRVLLLAFLTAFIACTEAASPPGSQQQQQETPPPTPTPLVPASVVKIAGDTQIALVSTAVAVPPTIEVKTSSGQPVPGTTVTFTPFGAGATSTPSATTDAAGRASAAWTLGSVAGAEQTLTATVANVTPIKFTAIAANPAAKVEAVTQTPVATVVSTPIQLTVLVRDANDQEAFNAAVTYSIASGAGSLSKSQALSSALGVASTTFTPSAAGAATIAARLATAAGPNTSVNFSLNVVASVALSAQTTQSFSANGGEVRAVTIRATSGGSAVANLPVTFSVSSNGGAVAAGATRTNSAGDATTNWTLPASSGTHRVTATAGGQSVVFTATVTYDPNLPVKIAPTSGDSVWVQPGATQSIWARVTNGANNGLAGVAVTFTTSSPGAGVGSGFGGPFSTSVTVNTTSSGSAIAYFKVGSTVGTYLASASAASLTPASFRVYAANPGAPKSLDQWDGSGAAVPATTTAGISPAVQVLDEHGIPIPNVDVTWTVTMGDGLISTATPAVEATSIVVKTSSTGFNTSSVAFRAGPTPGTNKITASVPGVAPVTFTIESTAMSVCSGIQSYTLGTSVSGSLSRSGSCVRYYDLGPPYLYYYLDAYRVTVTQTTIVEVSLSAASYTPAIRAAGETRFLRYASGSPATTRLILPPGTHYLGATSASQDRTGSYTLSSTLNPDLSTGSNAAVARGINAALNVRTSSSFSNAPYNAVGMDIFLWSGEQITVDMKSANFDAFLGVYSNGTWVATDDNSGGGTDAKIVFTAPRAGTYFIYAGTKTDVVPANRGFTLGIQ